MKRNLIYLLPICTVTAAAKVTAQTTPETPAEKIRPQRIEAGFTKIRRILFRRPSQYIKISKM